MTSTQMGKNLLLRCLLPTLLGVFVVGSSVEAAVLENWRFELEQNRLSFTTQGGVQPKAQLVYNPTRLVINLPGTTLGNIRTSQVVGGGIKAVRVGQLEPETAQIVVELNIGYTIDPNQVKFRGESPSKWTVQLPTPQALDGNSTVTPPKPAPPPPRPNPTPPLPPENVQPPNPTPAPQPTRRQTPPPPPQSTPERELPTTVSTLVEDIDVRGNGVVMLTSGQLPQFELKRGLDRTWMTIDILGARLTAKDIKQNQLFNRSGVTVTQISQFSNSPPVVRLTLALPDTNREWQARAYPGGIAVWPQGAVPPSINEGTGFATIRSVELKNGTELVLQADRPVNYTSGWDPETEAYGITIFNAKVNDGLKLPTREVGSPLLWVRLRQEDPETVTLLVKPATRIELGEINQVSAQQLSLPMGWGQIGEAPPGWRPDRAELPPQQRSNRRPPRWPLPNRRSENPTASEPPNRGSFPSAGRRRPWPWPLPRRNDRRPSNRRSPWPAPAPQRDGRVMIVIDPGHGGPTDLGGVGFGGMREKDIVLPMSLEVAQILERNNIQVVMTRKTDRDLDLPPRADLANRVNADLFVSIHANAISMSRPDVNGLETFYYETGRVLAQYIQNSMLESFPTMNDRGVRRARFYVLRNTAMPAALVEVGFVTGNYDSRILADPRQRSRMAQAVARGILQYVNAYYR